MIKKLVKKEVMKFHLYLVASIFMILTIWVVNYFISNLLAISIVFTVYILYLLFKKSPKFIFWKEIENKYKNGLLDEFINEKYESQKILYENKRNQTSTTNILSQQLVRKSIFMKKKNHDKMKHLLQLKKLLELEKKDKVEIF